MEDAIVYTTLFIFGAIFGSFLNVVALRFNTGRSLNNRSCCPTCTHTLAWYHLVPVCSYLALRGRCESCGARVSPRYLLVELGTGLLFVLAFITATNAVMLALTLLLFSLLVVIFLYDVRHFIIPDQLVVGVAAVASALVLYQAWQASRVEVVLFALAAAAAAFGFFALLWAATRGRGIGFGDAKLAAPLGLLLGLEGVFSFIVFAFWIGAVVGGAVVAVAWYRRNHWRVWERFAAWVQRWWMRHTVQPAFFPLRYVTIHTAVPFAPFLILAFLLVWTTELRVLPLLTTLLYG